MDWQNWEQIRRAMLEYMGDWVRKTRGAGAVVHPAHDRVWAVYQCSGCGMRRAGFDRILFTRHDGCGVAARIAQDRTLAEARAMATDPVVLGVALPPGLRELLTPRERDRCARRLVEELVSRHCGGARVGGA